MTAHDILTAFNALPPDQQQFVVAEILRRAPRGGDLPDAVHHELAFEALRGYDADEEASDETSLEHVRFPEEKIAVLSDRDRDRFLELISSPPAPNDALRRLMSKHRMPDV